MSTGTARIRIYAVDDHPIVHSAIGNEPDFQAPCVPWSKADNHSSRILIAKAPHACKNAASRKP
jgi:hypothetical protein